jgi:RND family efflux transporter MFP subunit
MRRAAVLPAAVLVAAALAACSKPAPAPDPVRAVKVTTAVAQPVGGTSEFAGEVRARTETRLGFRVGGKIVARDADLGDRVRAGQVLARLDPQDLKLGERAADAAVAAAQANHDQAGADFARFKELRDQGFISGAELERRETALKASRAQLEQARAQHGVQGNQADYAALVSGANGVVTGIDAEPGMVVAAGTPVLRLAHDGPRDVVFAVPEDRIALIQALAADKTAGSGGAGRFRVKLWGANGAAPLPATIREVAAAADPVTRTFLVKADIGAAGGAARLGQTATVSVELPQAAAAIKLPLAALKQEQGRTIVWVVERATMTVRAQPVELAGADGNDAVLEGGVQGGDVVVIAGVHVLSPGQKVRFWADPGATAVAASAR